MIAFIAANGPNGAHNVFNANPVTSTGRNDFSTFQLNIVAVVAAAAAVAVVRFLLDFLVGLFCLFLPFFFLSGGGEGVGWG